MDVAVLVNSCHEYYGKTLPVILSSLARAGVDASRVFVVVGDSARPSKETVRVNEVAYDVWKVTESNVDTTALIWAVGKDGREALLPFEYVFYVHDTVEVLPVFGQNLDAVLDVWQKPDALKLGHFSMSMGYYNMNALRRLETKIMALANHDPERRSSIKPESEDQVFRLMQEERMVVKSLGQYCDVDETFQPYGGQKRRRETWATPGFIKYKANWGQGGCYIGA